MKKNFVIALAAASGLALFATAQDASAQDATPWFATNRAGGFVDMWPAKDFFSTMFGADLQFRVARSVYLDVSITGAYASGSVNVGPVSISRAQAAFGNPTIGAHYAGEIKRNFHFFVGGTASLPLLHDPDYDVGVTASGVLPIRGYYDMDRLVVGEMAIRGMFGFEWQIARPFFFRGEARPVVFFSTNDRRHTFGHANDFVVETAAEAEYRWGNGVGLGGRFQVVYLPTFDGDQAQALFEPFFTLTPRTSGFYLRAGTPVALDNDLGPGFDRDRLFGVRLALGGQW
ncbi:MAG: hypothetical protein U0441_24015 [Polyangiaceae bacterium]